MGLKRRAEGRGAAVLYILTVESISGKWSVECRRLKHAFKV